MENWGGLWYGERGPTNLERFWFVRKGDYSTPSLGKMADPLLNWFGIKPQLTKRGSIHLIIFFIFGEWGIKLQNGLAFWGLNHFKTVILCLFSCVLNPIFVKISKLSPRQQNYKNAPPPRSNSGNICPSRRRGDSTVVYNGVLQPRSYGGQGPLRPFYWGHSTPDVG